MAKALKMGPGTWDRKPLKKEPPLKLCLWKLLHGSFYSINCIY